MARTAALRAMLRDGARFWLSALVLVSCVASAYAKASVADGTDSPRSRALHWGAVAAGGALLAQLMLGAGEGEKTDEQGEVNTSLELTWREDEGASKLVPIYPGKLAHAVRVPTFPKASSRAVQTRWCGVRQPAPPPARQASAGSRWDGAPRGAPVSRAGCRARL